MLLLLVLLLLLLQGTYILLLSPLERQMQLLPTETQQRQPGGARQQQQQQQQHGSILCMQLQRSKSSTLLLPLLDCIKETNTGSNASSPTPAADIQTAVAAAANVCTEREWCCCRERQPYRCYRPTHQAAKQRAYISQSRCCCCCSTLAAACCICCCRTAPARHCSKHRRSSS